MDRDPDKRWTAVELLSHDYFKGFSFQLPPDEGSYDYYSSGRDKRKVCASCGVIDSDYYVILIDSASYGFRYENGTFRL